MTIVERIQGDVNEALKRRDQTAVSTLRMLSAALKNAAIQERGELTEEQVLVVVQREAKRRKEAIAAYTEGGSADRAEQERAELAVLQAYLPQQLDDAAIEKTIQGVIAALGATGPQDFGKVMGAAMKELRGAADGNAVQAAVKRLLTPQ